MKKLKVAVILGGRSGEHEVSLRSGLSVYESLDKSKYDVTMIGIDKNGRWLLPDPQKMLAMKTDPMKIKLQDFSGAVTFPPGQQPGTLVSLHGDQPSLQFDVLFPVLHGTYGEDGTIQGLFELINTPYVGSRVLGSSVCMDKDVTKRLMRDAGIPVVPYMALRKKQWEQNKKQFVESIEKEFKYPFFVKPANSGSSVGVFKIKSNKEAQRLIDESFLYDTKVLIEKAVSARELECSVLGNEEPQASVIGEIIPRGEFYSYEAKYIDDDGAVLEYPAKNLSPDMIQKIQTMALKAFTILECRGLARVDFFLDKNTQELFINELNTLPGFTSISMYPKLWEASGVSYSKLLDKLIDLAVEEHQVRSEIKTSVES